MHRGCGSTLLNLTRAWWSTLWSSVANHQWHPATAFGGSAVMWALPKPLFGLMGDCFIYLLFIYNFKTYIRFFCMFDSTQISAILVMQTQFKVEKKKFPLNPLAYIYSSQSVD